MGAAPILTILKNGETVKSLSIEGEMILGRSEGCVIRLDDRAISRQHAVFRAVSDGIQVEKKSEFAPLKVNGNECTRAVVKEGDVIAIGPYLMRMTLPKLGRGDGTPRAAKSAAKAELDAPLNLDLPAPDGPLAATAGNGAAMAGPGEVLELSEAGLQAPPSQQESSEGSQSATPKAEDPFAAGMLDLPALEAGTNGNSATPEADAPELGLEMELGGDPAGMPGLESPPADGLPAAGINELLVVQEGAAPALEHPDSQEGSGRAAVGGDDAATRFVINPNLDARLIIPDGYANVTEFELNKDEVIIGRGKNCDIVLDDKKSSRRNTLIRREQGRFIIKDLDSANGTWVNGERIDEQVLSGDDVIKIGFAELTFRVVRGDYAEQEKDFLQIPSEDDALRMDAPAAQVSHQDMAAFPGMGGPPSPHGAPPQFGMQGLAQGMGQVHEHALDQGQVGSELGGGFGAVPGIDGMGVPKPQKKQSLMEKFRALPKRRQYIWIALILGILYFGLFDDDSPVPTRGKKGKKTGVTAATGQLATGKDGKDKSLVTFESLSDKDRQFVISKHELAFDYYRNKEYDKSLFELSQLFSIIPDYKDSREIERYAKEGKRKLEAFEEEKRHREEEARLKARIAQLIDDTKEKMAKKQYDQAKELFGQILAMDPENPLIAAWRKTIEDFEEELRLKDQQRIVREEINRQAWTLYKDALKVKAAGRLKTAIGLFGNVLEINAPDPKVSKMAKFQIAQCRAEIKAARDPVMAEAKQAEDGGDFAKAYQLYLKAEKIDPGFAGASAGMNRIRGVLHERSKTLYVEAVLAESYSDFSTARKKYGECLVTAPPDDIYHDRAERKLARFLKKEEPAQ